MVTFHRIVCPIDFSESSYEALDKAIELSSHGGTELCLVHVLPTMVSLQKCVEMTGNGLAMGNEAELRADAVAAMGRVLHERVPRFVRARPLLRQGDIAGQIISTAVEEDAGLIVLSTHGTEGWKPGAIGPVVDEVLRSAPCPVLTVSGPSRGHAWKTDDSLIPDLNHSQNGSPTSPPEPKGGMTASDFSL